MIHPDSEIESAGSTGFSAEPAGSHKPRAGGPIFSAANSTPRAAQLERQLAAQKRINERLLAVAAYQQIGETTPDAEHSARKMVAALARVYDCALIAIFQIQQTEERLKLLSSAGEGGAALAANPPDEFLALVEHARQESCVFGSTPLRAGDLMLTMYAAAAIQGNGGMQGLLLLADRAAGTLQPADVQVAQAAAAQIGRAWGFAGYTTTLTSFEQSIANLSMIQSAGSMLEMIATTARRTLNAHCTFVATQRQNEWLLRGSGKAPLLFHALQNDGLGFLEEAMHSPYTFRMRDIASDPATNRLPIDTPELRSLLASPIRSNGVPIGVLLAFGKRDGAAFHDGDVFLAELLTSHTASNLESTYLNHELRGKLDTTQLLYELGLRIVQAETLPEAAEGIVRAAQQLFQARRCGLVLFTADGRKQAEVVYPAEGQDAAPVELVAQAMNSRQSIYISESEQAAMLAIPLQTPRRCFGGLWMELFEGEDQARRPTEDLHFLVNQAAVALERSILLEETRQQARELSLAYTQLNSTYEQTLTALMRTLDARDRETEGHSERVTRLSIQMGHELGLSKAEIKALERGALLHDIGKIGVSDAILLKRGTLNAEEWQIMRRHPEIGAQIIQEIPALHDALPVIAFHHERWNGSGYPMGLAGSAIPQLARLFAIIDVFDALTRARPYRATVLSNEEALTYLQSEAGQLFDPEIVALFCEFIRRQSQHNPTFD